MLIGIIGIFLYYPVCILMFPNFQFGDKLLDVKYNPSYVVIQVQIKLLIGGLNSFFLQGGGGIISIVVKQIILCILFYLLSWLSYKLKPCLVSKINFVESYYYFILAFIFTCTSIGLVVSVIQVKQLYNLKRLLTLIILGGCLLIIIYWIGHYKKLKRKIHDLQALKKHPSLMYTLDDDNKSQIDNKYLQDNQVNSDKDSDNKQNKIKVNLENEVYQQNNDLISNQNTQVIISDDFNNQVKLDIDLENTQKKIQFNQENQVYQQNNVQISNQNSKDIRDDSNNQVKLEIDSDNIQKKIHINLENNLINKSNTQDQLDDLNDAQNKFISQNDQIIKTDSNHDQFQNNIDNQINNDFNIEDDDDKNSIKQKGISTSKNKDQFII